MFQWHAKNRHYEQNTKYPYISRNANEYLNWSISIAN